MPLCEFLLAARPSYSWSATEDGTYEVSYLINLVGHYTVSINMFGQEIHGSPFELLVAGGVLLLSVAAQHEASAGGMLKLLKAT